MGAVNTTSPSSHRSGGWKSAVSPEASLLGLPMALCGPLSVCVRVLMSSRKDISHIGRGLAQMTSSYLNHLFENSTSKYSHLLRSWGLGLQHVNLGEHNSDHNVPEETEALPKSQSKLVARACAPAGSLYPSTVL